MNTTENNKLMAEFLGSYQQYTWNYNHKCWFYNNTKIAYGDSNGEFHRNWNWLMQVVEKIEKTKKGTIIIHSKNIVEISFNYKTVKHYTSDLITNLFFACVEFIKWYNKEQSNRAIQDSIDLDEWSK